MDIDFDKLKGVILKSVSCATGDEVAEFRGERGDVYQLYHGQECCENVRIIDVCGDIDDLLWSPITMAEEVSDADGPESYSETMDVFFTWTFYKLATIKGYVTVRWLGESNGGYSERVSFRKV